MAEGRGAGAAFGVLEGSSGGSSGGAGVAGGPSAASGAELSGSDAEFLAGRRNLGRGEASQQTGRRDAVHDLAGSLSDVAVPLHRAGGHSGGLSNRQPDAGRDGGIDRFFCEHVGAANQLRRRAEFPRSVGTSAGDDVGGVCASGPAVRKVGGRSAAGAELKPPSDVPGDVRAAAKHTEQAEPNAGSRASAGADDGDGEVRSDI